MANFDEAYNKTLANEGGYDNDPDDAGGETYKGIARKFWGNWPGWAIIDASKSEPDFPQCLKGNVVLDKMVRDYYKTNYWNRFAGDEVPSQIVANEIFDTGVNMGMGRAVTFLQTTLNLLNKNGKLYPDIVEDGKFGNGTLNTLIACLSLGEEELIYKIINVMQGHNYIEYMKKDPKQEKFARGWFSRVSFVK